MSVQFTPTPDAWGQAAQIQVVADSGRTLTLLAGDRESSLTVVLDGASFMILESELREVLGYLARSFGTSV